MTDYVPRCPVCRSFSVNAEWNNAVMYYKCRDCGYVFKWPR